MSRKLNQLKRGSLTLFGKIKHVPVVSSYSPIWKHKVWNCKLRTKKECRCLQFSASLEVTMLEITHGNKQNEYPYPYMENAK